MKRRRTTLLTLTALLAAGLTALPAAPAGAEEVEQLKNGTFDTTTEPWWATTNVTAGLSDARVCADVPGGTTNRWDAAVGQNDTFTSPVDTPQGQVAFQVGGSADAWRFCMDDASLLGGVPPEVYEPDTGPRVRVNQVAYLPAGPKNATLVTDATGKLPWQLKNASGAVVAHGWTVPRGTDASSAQNVHSIDFGAYRKQGKDFTLVADGEASRPFDIGTAAYERLRLDAVKYYYTQRHRDPG